MGRGEEPIGAEERDRDVIKRLCFKNVRAIRGVGTCGLLCADKKRKSSDGSR